MIDESIIRKYLDDISDNMVEESQIDLRNLLTSFFNKTPISDISCLKKDELVEMYSSMMLMKKNSFLTHRSKVGNFVKWMDQQSGKYDDLLNNLYQIQYHEINRDAYYSLYYFSDINDLFFALNEIFSESESDFDTFKAAAILVWYGIDIKYLNDILKKDLDTENKLIVHPVSKETIVLSEGPADIIYFLKSYRDATTYSTQKCGGRTLKYMPSEFLFRSYKNAHFTQKQIAHISTSANKKAQNFGKIFRWQQIYLSGLYYRIYQYEQIYGKTEQDIEKLKRFFSYKGALTKPQKVDIKRKYMEYQEFKEHLYFSK